MRLGRGLSLRSGGLGLVGGLAYAVGGLVW